MTPREVCAADTAGRIICVELPPLPVRVQDPTGAHRLFGTPQRATRRGVNQLGGTVMSVVVRVAGRDWIVRPDWVGILADTVSNVVPFRRPGA